MAVMHTMRSSYHGDPGRIKRWLRRWMMRLAAVGCIAYVVWCAVRIASGASMNDPYLRMMLTMAKDSAFPLANGFLPVLPPLLLALILWVFSNRLRPWSDPEKVGQEQAGADGEAYVRQVLKRLPNTCHVFSNLEFSTMGRDGKRYPHETDCVVVGPAGVTVVEVKNWSGRIEGGYGDEHITRIRKNGQQERGVHNPVHQVQVHAGSLGALLRHEVKHPFWVESCVFFVADHFENGLRGSTNTAVFMRGEEKALLRAVNSRTEYSPEAVREMVQAVESIADNK